MGRDIGGAAPLHVRACRRREQLKRLPFNDIAVDAVLEYEVLGYLCGEMIVMTYLLRRQTKVKKELVDKFVGLMLTRIACRLRGTMKKCQACISGGVQEVWLTRGGTCQEFRTVAKKVLSNPATVPLKLYRRMRRSLAMRAREKEACKMQVVDPVTFLLDRLPGQARADTQCMNPRGASNTRAVRICDYLSSLLVKRLWLSEDDLQNLREYALANLQDAIERTVYRANRVCDGILPVWGEEDCDVGMPIPWYRDPASGSNWPLLYWERVREKAVGDVDAVWELGRHLFLPSLGRAFLYTREERYRKSYFDIIDDWIGATPYGYGVHWASPLECTIRSLSWLFTLMTLLPLPEVYASSFCSQVARLVQHVEHTLRHLSIDTEFPNNHLIAQCVGVLIVQSVLPELFEADVSTQAETILMRELSRQIDGQGLHRELCPFYHQFVWFLLVQLGLIYRRAGRGLPQELMQAIHRMTEVSPVLETADGYLPDYIGDRGTAKMERFFIPEVSARDIARMSRFLVLGEYPEGPWTEAILWYIGVPSWVSGHTREQQPRPRSAILPDSGWCISRSGVPPEDWWLLFKAGRMGYGDAGHGHADALSVCARIGEQLILADTGTYTYGGAPEWRSYFRSTAAHNTIRVDGKDQAIAQDVFGWDRSVDATLIGAIAGEDYDVFAAYHDAYAPIRHTRFVVAVHGCFWLVLDRLSGDTAYHTWELSWHLAPCEDILQEGDHIKAYLGALQVFVGVKADHQVSREVYIGCTSPIRGWFSPRYYVKVPCPTIVYRGEIGMPRWIASLIVPSHGDLDVQWNWIDNTAYIRVQDEDYAFAVAEVGRGVYSLRGYCRRRTLFLAHMGGGGVCDAS